MKQGKPMRALWLLSALLTAAGALLLWRINLEQALPADRQAAAPTAAETEDFFTAFRRERTQERAAQAQYLQELIEEKAVSAQSKREAEKAKLTLVAAMETERIIEQELRFKGYADAAVTVGAQGVQVVVKAEALSAQDTALITECACRSADCAPAQVYLIASP